MILPRDLYSSPPAAKNARQDNPTLLVSWWCTGFALAIILVRICGRYIRTERLFREDKIMALSIVPLFARMALVHVVLIWGTNNALTVGLTAEDIRHREIGSRLVLASRIFYAMFIWIAKFTVSEFLKRLTSQVWRKSYEVGLQCIRWFLIVTFIAVVIGTLTECQPFDHYWQVVTDPGAKCRQGMAQLMTMGTSDVITDLLLIGYPIPIVLKSHMAAKRKVSLVLLFALSLILVGITIYRVIGVTDRHADQQFRSLLASLEILAAAAVSNALVLGSFVRDRGAKKQRFRFGSTGGHSSLDRMNQSNRRAITQRDWGSDANLAEDLCMRLDPELSDQKPKLPRPAPVALSLASKADTATAVPITQDWTFPNRKSADTDEIDMKSPHTALDRQPSPGEVPTTPRGMSFFDVGGLLEGNSRPPTRPTTRQAIPPLGQPQQQPPLSNPSPAPPSASGSRKGSHALLQDIGGLLSPGEESSPTSRRRDLSLADILKDSQPSSPTRLVAPPSSRQQRGAESGLQDVGGLLG